VNKKIRKIRKEDRGSEDRIGSSDPPSSFLIF